MPRVYTQKASRRKYRANEKRLPEGVSVGDLKPNYRCEWPGCEDQEIKPGEEYLLWSFRYGGDHRMHARHGWPRASMLTQSKMATVYEAQESLDLTGLESEEDIRSALQELASVVEEVSSEYAEAAEAFGGAGENQDRADELEGWASDLSNWSPDASEPERCDLHSDGEDEEEEPDCGDCADNRESWIYEMHGSALDLVGACPL